MKSYSINKVFDRLRNHLRHCSDRIRCFGKYEFQAEGWFKGEWISVLEQMRKSGQIIKLDREVDAKGRKKIDIAFELDDGWHWVELKHWLSEQKGHRWRTVDYIYGLENECDKLAAKKTDNRSWIVVLYTPNPGNKEWMSALAAFNRENVPWRLQPIDKPSQYPKSYFLGVIKVRGLNA